MALLALKGHATRGNEVIERLKMFKGYMNCEYKGNEPSNAYYLNDRLEICCVNIQELPRTHIALSLEEFEEIAPYKVGDEVILKDRWGVWKIIEMLWYINLHEVGYGLLCNDGIEVASAKNLLPKVEHKTIPQPQHEMMSKIKSALTNKQYMLQRPPDFYTECCSVLGADASRRLMYEGHPFYYEPTPYDRDTINMLEDLRKLKVCRDAYWVIAGENLRLNEPWKPDFTDVEQIKYCICVSRDTVGTCASYNQPCFLAFPTPEMATAFYKNFKRLIKRCKEFLQQ